MGGAVPDCKHEILAIEEESNADFQTLTTGESIAPRENR